MQQFETLVEFWFVMKFPQKQQVYSVILSGCGLACPKLCDIVSYLHFNDELSFKVGFLNVVIQRSLKYCQSFQVCVVRHVQSDSKQLVSYISKMNIDRKSFFCKWLGIQKNIYLFQSICMSMVKRTWAC